MTKFHTLFLALATATTFASASIIQTRDEKPDFDKPFNLTFWVGCETDCVAEGQNSVKVTQLFDGSKSTTSILDFPDESDQKEWERVAAKIEFQSASDDPKEVWIDDGRTNSTSKGGPLHVQCRVSIDANTASESDFLKWSLDSVKFVGRDNTEMYNGAWKATCTWT